MTRPRSTIERHRPPILNNHPAQTEERQSRTHRVSKKHFNTPVVAQLIFSRKGCLNTRHELLDSKIGMPNISRNLIIHETHFLDHFTASDTSDGKALSLGQDPTTMNARRIAMAHAANRAPTVETITLVERIDDIHTRRTTGNSTLERTNVKHDRRSSRSRRLRRHSNRHRQSRRHTSRSRRGKGLPATQRHRLVRLSELLPLIEHVAHQRQTVSQARCEKSI